MHTRCALVTGVQPFALPIWHLYSLASKRVIVAAPDLDAMMFFQVVSTSPPSGLTMPRPVTTTRRICLLRKIFLAQRRPSNPSKGDCERDRKSVGRESECQYV